MKTRFGWILLLCLIMVALALPVMAEEVYAEGTCGDNLTWVLDNEGVLTISGTGDMIDFTTAEDAPWYEHILKIKQVVIANNVTSIGNYAFYSDPSSNEQKTYMYISSIVIADSVTRIGNYAFHQCPNLSSANLGNGVKTIGNNAFLNCQALTSIVIPKSVENIGDIAFMGCTNLESATFEGDVPQYGSSEFNIYYVFYSAAQKITVYYYDGAKGWENQTDKTINLQKLSPPSEYTATLFIAPAATTVNGQVNVTVEANKSFSAAELTLTYDTSRLSYHSVVSSENNTESILENNGTIKLAGIGQTKDQYTISFYAQNVGIANVTLTSAAFSTAEDAATEDLTTAIIENGIVSVTVNPTVILPSDGSITGSDTVVYGETYTFNIAGYDTNNNYDITATMGGEQVTVTNNGNGEYSIANVTDTLEISVTVKPKTYTVTFSKEADMTMLPDTADVTYGILYSIGLPVREHYTAKVTAYYDTSEKPVLDYSIENGILKIAGNAIIDNIFIEVSWTQIDAKVTVGGSSAGDVQDTSGWAVYGKDYTLTVNQDNAYTYTVTAAVNSIVVNLTNNGNVYTLSKDNIPAGANIVFTVEKTLAMNISVTTYLTLNGGQNLYLVLNTVDKVDGMVYCYGDTAMFWSEKYQSYCTLTTASSTLTANEITLTSSAGSSDVIDYSLDINNSGNIDVNDAQFVYNMYTAVYSGITETVTAEKYLRADINGDKKVDTEDAAAIVYQILHPNGANS